MKMNYQITGNNYACVAIDAKTLMERVSAQFHNQNGINNTIEEIRRWSKNCYPGAKTEIDGFTLSTIERR